MIFTLVAILLVNGALREVKVAERLSLEQCFARNH